MPIRDPEERRKYFADYYLRRKKQGFTPPTPAITAAPGDDPHVKRKLIVWLPKSLLGRLSHLLLKGQRDGQYVWKDQSDQLDDLIHRGLGTVRGVEAVDEQMRYLQATRAIRAIANQRNEIYGSFSAASHELIELQGIKAWDAAVHFYHSTTANFIDLKGCVYGDWFLQKMKETFPKLHAATPKPITLDDRDVVEEIAGPRAAKLLRLPPAKDPNEDDDAAIELQRVMQERADRRVIGKDGKGVGKGRGRSRRQAPRLEPAAAGPTKRVVVIPDRRHPK